MTSNHLQQPPALLLGLGGHQEWDTSLTLYDRLSYFLEELHHYNPNARVEFLDGVPANEADAETAIKMGMPYRSFVELFILGGSMDWPDAVESIKKCAERIQRFPSLTHVDMQIHGSNTTPSIEALIDFFKIAWELMDPLGVTLCVETHIDRISYDPRHLLRIHQALLEATEGQRGLLISADFSHYIHQLTNTHSLYWSDQQIGSLNLNPFDPNNIVSSQLIPSGLVRMGHLRMAIPNNLTREQGTIQYPIVDPALDPFPTDYDGLWDYGTFDKTATSSWKAWYRELFHHILSQPTPTPALFSTEFIRYGGEYAREPYRNQFQNLAMLSYANDLRSDLRSQVQASLQGIKS